MYPRNNAVPPIIDLGEIVLKADGTQQTTGASARVKIGTAAWGAAAGTLACDATSGIWTYAPTQAETNADYFIVAAYKTNCTSVSKTIITSNSATAGQVRLEGVTHTSAVIPTVSAVTGLTVGNLDVAVSSRMATYTQPTGFLAATFPTGTIANTTNITAGTITTATNLTNLPSIPNNWLTAAGIADNAITDAKVASDVTIASVTGSVGSVAGNVAGSVGSVVGNVGGNVTGSVASVAGAVGSVTGLNVAHIDAAISSRATVSGIFAGTVPFANDSFNAVLQGLNATTFDTLAETAIINIKLPMALVDGRIEAFVGAMGSNVVTADSIATDAVTEIQNGLSTLDAVDVRSAIGLASANLDTQIADLPTVAEFNARSLPSADYFVVSDYTEPDNAGIAANGVAISNVPTLAEIEASTVLAKEATVAAKASQSSVDTKPTLSQIEASTILAKEATVESKASQTSVDGKPSLAQIEASTVLAKEATVLTVASYLDTEMAAVKAVTDKLNTTVELDGLVYRFTINALEQAPSGGGGGGDPWNTELPGSYTGDQAGKLLSDIASATSTGRVTVVSPVAEQGRVFPLVIGDDYLVDNNRALEWTTPEIAGIDIEDATCRFWILKDGTGYSWEGTVGPGSSGYWVLSVEITNDSWEDAEPGVYEYGVEVIDAINDQQITVAISSKDGGVRLRRKE